MISRQNPPAPPPLLRCGCRRGWVLSSLLRPAPASCGPLPGLWTLWTPDNDTLQSTSHITCNRSHMEHNTRLGTGGHYRLLSSPCSCTAPICRSPSSLNTLITQSTALLHHRNTVTTDHWAEYLLNIYSNRYLLQNIYSNRYQMQNIYSNRFLMQDIHLNIDIYWTFADLLV